MDYTKILYFLLQLFSVIIQQKTMLKPKQNIPSNLPIKNKSTYARQFDDFEKRLEKNRIATKFPSLPLRSKKISLLDSLKGEQEYLELAKRLMSNKEKFNICQQKENMFDLDEKSVEELAFMKNKIMKMKNQLSHRSNVQTATQVSENAGQHFYQLNGSKQLKQPTLLTHRSRALSNAAPILHEKDLNEGPNFLHYKKCRRELSSRSKNE